MPELIVYTRLGCHLCEDMLATLHQFSEELNYRVRIYDVDEDPALYERFNTLVPVVYYQGCEVMRHFFELATLTEVLAKQETSGGEE